MTRMMLVTVEAYHAGKDRRQRRGRVTYLADYGRCHIRVNGSCFSYRRAFISAAIPHSKLEDIDN